MGRFRVRGFWPIGGCFFWWFVFVFCLVGF